MALNRKELEALRAWWDDFTTKAISVPVKAKRPGDSELISFHRDVFAPEYQERYDSSCDYVLIDPLIVNEKLRELDTRVTLTWETVDTGAKRLHIDRNGKRRMILNRKHVLTKGRFQLGQRKGNLPRYILETKGSYLTWTVGNEPRIAASRALK